jgi:Tfp pilus assembly protein PilX
MKTADRQTGQTLITALVMLVVLTLLVVSAIRASTTNLLIASNTQIKEEAIGAAQQATEQVVSNNFTINPVSSTIPVSIGGTTYPVNVAQPVCTGTAPLMNNTPNLPPECLSSGTAQNTGIFFASGASMSGMSWCYSQQWEVRTNVTDTRTGATANMHQGVSLKVPAGTSC